MMLKPGCYFLQYLLLVAIATIIGVSSVGAALVGELGRFFIDFINRVL